MAHKTARRYMLDAFGKALLLSGAADTIKKATNAKSTRQKVARSAKVSSR